jgi:hypothetical protein
MSRVRAYQGCYRSPVHSKVWWAVIGVADLILLANLTALTGSPHPAAAVVVGVCAVVALAIVTRSGFVGMRLDDEGALVLNPIRTIRVTWERIDRFELVQRNGKTRIVTTDRRSVYPWGVQEWNWASTLGRSDTPERRWVEEWNAMLAKHRATAP